MSQVVSSLLGMSREVIQVCLYNMSNVMKSIVHSPLKICSSILQAEWELFIRKDAPRTDESSFMLVVFFYGNLVVSRESIHEGKRFASGTIVKNLINERCRIVVFWTSGVQIVIIDANSNSALFFINGNRIGNPFS